MSQSPPYGQKGNPIIWGDSPVAVPSIEQDSLHMPAGTVTFMLTDVEGSTRLWESDPEAMTAAIARHYQLLDAAVGLHGGVRPVEQGEGDSSVAAFTRASDALGAALDAQLAFHAEQWPAGAALRIRIALHTAEAQSRDEGHYFGQAVNRCARLRAIAHGGQVLLSQATHDLVLDRLPEGADLADLGLQRLGDLSRPEHAFELRHPDLPGGFPPLRSLDAHPNNLPGEMSSFVGRRLELGQVGELLRHTRLLTLTGAGGCGKTRLAAQAAADALDDHPDGVWWVELAQLEDPELVSTALIGAIGLREPPGRLPVDTLVEHLGARRALVVLNNCEHVLAACTDLADGLLRACPTLTMLTTSRAPLGVPGETAWRVPSMSLPNEPSREPIESLGQFDAVRLFLERATQVRPNFSINADNAPAVAQICQDVDGIPLAIELAAARVRMMAPEQIRVGLGDRFHLLTGGGRTVMPRHRTLEASIEWSHDLLTEGERVLLRRLSVFAGGWTLDAAEDVCSGGEIDRYAVLDLLTGLVDKSLVTTDEQVSEVRYGLLKSVHQYATARLLETGESNELRDRHLAHHLTLADRSEPEVLRAGLNDPVLERLTIEMPNLRAALEHASTTVPANALSLSAALHLFWMFTGRYGEGDAAYARALDAGREGPALLRGRALWGRSHLGMYSGRYEEVPGWAQEALEIGESCGDVALQARAHLTLGGMLGVVQPAGGQPLLERSAELARQAGDEWCRVEALGLLAWCWIWQDEFDTARSVIEEAHAASTMLGYRWGAAMYYWLALARINKLEGHLAEANRLMSAMAASGDELGDPVTAAIAGAGLAWVALEQGQAEVAQRHIAGPLAQVTKTGAGLAAGFANQALARAEMILGDLAAARRHLEVAIDADSLGLSYFLPEHLAFLGRVELMEGNAAAARARADEALEVAIRLGSGWMQAYPERLLGRLALAEGDVAAAEHYVHDALVHLLANSLMLCVPECLDILAAIAASQESYEESARLAGAASAGREGLGTVRFPPEPEFWARVETSTRGALGDDGYAAAFTAGAALDVDEAVGYARRARGERRRPSTGWDSLTPTELEVVRHIAAGLTNPQIGERMFISRGTAKVHVSHIFAKLGISSRSELAAEATRRGLVATIAADAGAKR